MHGQMLRQLCSSEFQYWALVLVRQSSWRKAPHRTEQVDLPLR